MLDQFANSDGGAPLFVVPSASSASAKSFFHQLRSALGVLITAVNSAIFADNSAVVAKKIIQNDLDLPNGFDPYSRLSDKPGLHLSHLLAVQAPLLEMILIRLSDNFTNYILDVVGECIRAKPDLLKSSKEQLATEVILSFASMDDLKQMLIERKLINIAYLGLEKQFDWMTERLGITGLRNLECLPNLIELVEARNCMVHNRGKVGEKYLKALAEYEPGAKVGDQLTLSVEQLYVFAKATEVFVAFLDQFLIKKYSLSLSP